MRFGFRDGVTGVWIEGDENTKSSTSALLGSDFKGERDGLGCGLPRL